MLNYELQSGCGILVLKPEGRLAAKEFRMLACHIDAHLDRQGALRGVMVQAGESAGWEDFGRLLAHLVFVRMHHRKIEKVAVVSDNIFAAVNSVVGEHFVRAKVKHYNPAHVDAAWRWLIVPGRSWLRMAA